MAVPWQWKKNFFTGCATTPILYTFLSTEMRDVARSELKRLARIIRGGNSIHSMTESPRGGPLYLLPKSLPRENLSRPLSSPLATLNQWAFSVYGFTNDAGCTSPTVFLERRLFGTINAYTLRLPKFQQNVSEQKSYWSVAQSNVFVISAKNLTVRCWKYCDTMLCSNHLPTVLYCENKSSPREDKPAKTRELVRNETQLQCSPVHQKQICFAHSIEYIC